MFPKIKVKETYRSTEKTHTHFSTSGKYKKSINLYINLKMLNDN